MFTLYRQPNALTTFAEHFGQNVAHGMQERNELAQRNAAIKEGFAKLGENPSRMEILQTIEGLQIPDAQKQRLYQGFGDIEKDRITREKSKAEEAKSEKEAIRHKKLANQYGISEEEAEGLKASDIPGLARTKNKPPPGGVRAQGVPPEVGAKLKKVLEEHPEATADELALALDQEGIPPTYSEKFIENRRRKEGLLAQDPYQQAAQQKQAHANVDIAEGIISKGEKAKQNLLGIEGMRRNIKSTGLNLRNQLADFFNQPAFRDPQSEEFKTYSKQSLFKAPEIVKGKVSNFEFQTIGDLYANVDKSPEANEALLDWQEYLEKVDEVEAKEANKILKENRGIPPADFRQQLNERVDKPVEKLTQEWRKKKDNALAKMFKRKVVPKGTPADEQVANNYLFVARRKLPEANDEQILKLAENMAREDGYEF